MVKKGQEWSEYQIEYLREHYPSDRAEDIGRSIGKSKQSVQHKANRLGIKKEREAFFKERSKAMSGEHSGNFKGYLRRNSHGYILCYRPENPFASTHGLVMEHRLVMEEKLGFVLPKEWDVHHINGIKDDNRIENLALMTHKAHTILHNKAGRGQRKGSEHPLFKDVDIDAIDKLRAQGMSVRKACSILGISKTNYYKKVRSA